MAKPVTHLSKITRLRDGSRTGTLCNRMTGGEINCTTELGEVTCKFCLKDIDAEWAGRQRAKFQAEAA